MLRTFSTCMALAVTTIAAHAQITVTNSVFPVVGDSLRYAFGNQPEAINAVFTPPGGDQMWDLSALQADSTWEAVYRDPATGVGSAAFPGASLLYAPADAEPGQEDYLHVSAEEVNLMGSHNVDPFQLGSSWTVHRSPLLPQSWAPLNFFDIRQATSNILHYYQPSEMPPGWTVQFPNNVDSIRMRATVTVLSVVDAWGTISIPGGSYPVLREKRTIYTNVNLDAKLQPLGFIDMTDIAISQYGMDAVLGIDTTVSFQFINDLSKETIAVCELNPAQNEVLRVRYKAADFSTAAEGAAAMKAAVRVFPNPALDRIRIHAPELQQGGYHLAIMDATGRQVTLRRGALGTAGLPIDLDISALDAGVFRGSIRPDTGEAVEFRFVKD